MRSQRSEIIPVLIMSVLDAVRINTRLLDVTSPEILLTRRLSLSLLVSYVQGKVISPRPVLQINRKGYTQTEEVVNYAETRHTWQGTVDSGKMVSSYQAFQCGFDPLSPISHRHY